MSDRPLLTVEQAAEYLGKSPKTLYQWSYEGTGPPVLRIGNGLRYDADDLKRWAHKQLKAR
jgi:excisionase family DNA binding protein